MFLRVEAILAEDWYSRRCRLRVRQPWRQKRTRRDRQQFSFCSFVIAANERCVLAHSSVDTMSKPVRPQISKSSYRGIAQRFTLDLRTAALTRRTSLLMFTLVEGVRRATRRRRRDFLRLAMRNTVVVPSKDSRFLLTFAKLGAWLLVLALSLLACRARSGIASLTRCCPKRCHGCSCSCGAHAHRGAAREHRISRTRRTDGL